MNSSTFSSESEWKVWTVVLAVLVAAEIALRGLLPHLSKDIVHLQQVPDRIEHLSNSEGARVLFLGNSITREGIDIKQFEDQLEIHRAFAVAEIHPDDTAIAEWFYAYLHFLELPERNIDELIICFAEDQLQDRPSINVRRIAANYSDWGTMLNAFQEEELSLDQQAEFILARLFVSFAYAERIQKRLLDYLIPYYRKTAGIINTSLQDPTNHGEGLTSSHPTYRRLQRLIGLLEARKVNCMVFAFPIGTNYELDPGLEQLLKTHRISFDDVRDLQGIGSKNFPDGYHMDESAAQIVTTAVAKKVSEQHGKR